jgi:hypothetical protein
VELSHQMLEPLVVLARREFSTRNVHPVEALNAIDLDSDHFVQFVQTWLISSIQSNSKTIHLKDAYVLNGLVEAQPARAAELVTSKETCSVELKMELADSRELLWRSHEGHAVVESTVFYRMTASAINDALMTNSGLGPIPTTV